MMRRAWPVVVAALWSMVGAGDLSQDPFLVNPQDNVPVDSATGTWRVFVQWRTPELVTDTGAVKALRERPDPKRHAKDSDRQVVPPTASPPPPEGWTQPEYDDSAWPRRVGPYTAAPFPEEDLYSTGGQAELALLCLRGKVLIDDLALAKDLRIQVRYYGGVAIYVNGREIKRAHLPEGELKPATPAEDYPPGAYRMVKGVPVEEVRRRQVLVLIPPAMLKKGVNVVAVEVHTARIHESVDQGKAPLWPHAYVERAMVRSAFGMAPKTVIRSFDAPVVVAARPETHVLDNEVGYWRVASRWTRPVIAKPDGTMVPLMRPPGRGQTWADAPAWPDFQTPPAPANWTAPDFDDHDWARERGPLGPVWARASIWSLGNPAQLAVLYARGAFEVTDPAAVKDLQFHLEYCGGAVVYVNGRELTRGHLPEGALSPDTLAETYPKEAYLRPDGFLISLGDAREYADHLRQYRLRSLTAPVPADLLRKGVNVVAVEVHRSPVREVYLTGRYQRPDWAGQPGVWPHAHLTSAALRYTGGGEGPIPGVAPAVRPLGKNRVWVQSVPQRLEPEDFGPPTEAAGTVRIVGTRNGAFSGQAVFEANEDVRQFRAAVTDLTGPAGTIPASAIEVTYPIRDTRDTQAAWLNARPYVTLTPDPPGFRPCEDKTGAVLQPVWLKVRVPRDARPGEYTGTLTASFKIGIPDINLKDAPPLSIPVHLKVNDWVLPEPKDFRTFMDLIQSPETVAIRYKVPLWSDEHFRYLEPSLRLLGEIGNKCVYVAMIARTHFGNAQTWVRYVRQADGSLTPEFSVFDRYLDLVERLQGKPSVVILYLWCAYTARNMAPLVSEVDPATGQVKEIEAPAFGTPEGKVFWSKAIQGVRERLAKRGLDQVMMLGLVGDFNRIRQDKVDFFKEVAPGAPWVSQGHGLALRIGDVPTGYATTVWNAGGPPDPYDRRVYGWQVKHLTCHFPRDLRGAELMPYRTLPEWNITGAQRGMGRLGADLWEVMTPAEKAEAVRVDSRHAAGLAIINRFAAYGDWGQLVVRTCFLAPGANGAISTAVFENLREGVQDCEARIFLESVLLDPAQKAKLGADLARRAEDVLRHRTWCAGHAHVTYSWFYLSGFLARQDELYATAAEVAKALGTGNGG